MANALQDYMRGIASGSFDITSPFFRAQANAQRNNAQAIQQRQLAERIRQFNSMLPIRQTTADASALTAQTGANKYASRNEDLMARTQAGILGNIGGALQGLGGIGELGELGRRLQNFPEPLNVAGLEEAARGKKVEQVSKEAEARRIQQQKGAKYKSELKKSPEATIRVIIGKIAEAKRDRVAIEREAARSQKNNYGPKVDYQKALAENDSQLQTAVRMYQLMTGKEAPTQQELEAVVYGTAQPGPATPRTRTATISKEDADYIDQQVK